MVTFVCGHCNTSLKKSQVPFHGCQSTLACVTCNKDFNKVTYKDHDRCLTEDEKYQGSDYKPKVNKGEARQTSWNDLVIESISKYQTNDKSLLNTISKLKNKSNIPQKEKKFKNFMVNISSTQHIDIIWKLISDYKASCRAAKEEKKVEEKTADIVKENDTFDQTVVSKVTKEKKRKIKDIDEEMKSDSKKLKMDEESEFIETTKNENFDKEKKKSKKKKLKEIDGEQTVNEKVEIKVDEEKKKKKDKSNVKEENVNETILEVVKNENIDEMVKNEKKDKKKKKQTDGDNIKENIVEEVLSTKKDKKKKKKSRVEEEFKENVTTTDEKDKKKKKKKSKEELEIPCSYFGAQCPLQGRRGHTVLGCRSRMRGEYKTSVGYLCPICKHAEKKLDKLIEVHGEHLVPFLSTEAKEILVTRYRWTQHEANSLGYVLQKPEDKAVIDEARRLATVYRDLLLYILQSINDEL